MHMNWFIVSLFSFLSLFVKPVIAEEIGKPSTQMSADQYLATSTDPLFVSLGSFCGPASTIQTAGLRKASFPIDWMLSVNGEKIISMLDNDFRHFTNPKFLVPFINGVLLNTFYEIEYSHEGVWTRENFAQQLVIFKEKYTRRIERFRRLRSYKGKIFFMRDAWPLSTHKNYAFSNPGNLKITPEYAKRLFAALKRYFPQVDVYLIIRNISEQDKEVSTKLFDKILITDDCLDLQQFLKIFGQEKAVKKLSKSNPK
jgi:hypothetical protein